MKSLAYLLIFGMIFLIACSQTPTANVIIEDVTPAEVVEADAPKEPDVIINETPEAPPPPPPPSPPAPKTVTIEISDNLYNPKNLEINAGDTVAWIHKDIVEGRVMPHILEISALGIKRKTLTYEEPFQHTFTEKGEFKYRDLIPYRDELRIGTIKVN